MSSFKVSKRKSAQALLVKTFVGLAGASVIVSAQSTALAQGYAGGVSPQQVQALFERPLRKDFIPDEVIVKLKPGARMALGFSATELAPLGLQTAPRRASGDQLVYSFKPSTLIAFRNVQEARQRILDVAKRLSARPDVEYAQPNWIVQPVAEPDDPRYQEQWHYFNNGTGPGESAGGINLPRAWETVTGNASVAVAVVDTGILPAHPDIAASPNLGSGYDMISYAFIANDGDGRDSDPTDPGDAVEAGECYPGSPARGDSWHGTHVAGTIGVGKTNNALGVAGVNWQVKAVPVRVLGKCGGTTVDINDGIRWAAGLPVPNVPPNANPAKVINMSLGGSGACSESPSTQSAIDDAVAAGATVVVAAGNSADDVAGYFPASCNNVITVAASDARGYLVTRYSNYGEGVEIMAPGGDVQRDDNGDGNPDGVLSMIKDTYAFYNGTSMAAPHVAGVAALLLAKEGPLSPADVLSRLQGTAIPRSATECPKPCGAGLVNAKVEPIVPPVGVFEYATKLVCGIQPNPKDLRLTTGAYATTINVHNPGRTEVRIAKKLALTIPPGFEKPGEIRSIATGTLGPDQAMAVDCEEIRRVVFGGAFPAPFIEGFVVIQSTDSLDVVAVYTTADLDTEALPSQQRGIDVEQVRERKME